MTISLRRTPTMGSSADSASALRVFRKDLRFWGQLSVAVSSIIGSGWLFASMYASSIAGPAAIISWIIAAILVLFIGLIYADLAKMNPEAGGVVRYSAYSHGLYSAGLISFGTFLALVAGGGSEVEAVLTYLSHFWPGLVSAKTQNLTVLGTTMAVLMLIVFTAVALAGVRWFARINVPWTILKVVVPFATLFLFLFGAFHPGNFTSSHTGGFAPFGVSGVFAAIPTSGIMYAFGGFRQAINMGSEGDTGISPKKVILCAVGLTAVLYLGLQVAWIGAMPGHLLAKGWSDAVLSSPWTTLAVGINLTWFATVLYVDAVVSPSGSMFTGVNTGARVTYSMSNPSRLLPSAIGTLSRKGVPAVALGVNLILSLISVVILHSWHSMVSVLSVLLGIEYGIGAVAVTVLAKRGSIPERRRLTRLIAPTAFVVAGLITYWAGWQYIRIGFPAVVVVASFAYWWSARQQRLGAFELFGGVWLVGYLCVILVLSLLGSYGKGLDVVPAPWDSILAGMVALAFYFVGVRSGIWYTSREDWRRVKDQLGMQHESEEATKP